MNELLLFKLIAGTFLVVTPLFIFLALKSSQYFDIVYNIVVPTFASTVFSMVMGSLYFAAMVLFL